MPITKDVSNTIQYLLKRDNWMFEEFGVSPGSQSFIAGDNDVLKQLRFKTDDQPTETTVILRTNPASANNIVVTLPATSGTLSYGGGGGGAAWGDITGTLSDQTDLQTALNAKQSTITGGATTIVSSNLTASRALASDGSGKVAVSAVTSTELGYVAGVTSALQTQLNAKLTAASNLSDVASAQVSRANINKGITTLTDGATINTDASLGNIFTVTLGGNRTLANPTNLQSGGTYQWIITQDGTGTRTLAYGNLFKWPGGAAPTLSTAAGAIDVISATYNGTVILAVSALSFS